MKQRNGNLAILLAYLEGVSTGAPYYGNLFKLLDDVSIYFKDKGIEFSTISVEDALTHVKDLKDKQRGA